MIFSGCATETLDGRRGHENVEWQVAYSYHLSDERKDLPRVLLIGDSIVKAYQNEVAKNLGDRVNLSFWTSSYCVTSPAYLTFLDGYLRETKYDVIHINNALHTPEGLSVEIWKRELRKAFELIRRRQPQAKLIWASGTPLKQADRTVWVRTLNAAAKEVVASFDDIILNDLYALDDPYDRETYWSDMYHHKKPLVEAEARQVARVVLEALGMSCE